MVTAGAKKHMEKVLDFVTERIESRTSMYGNTKDQLLEIAKLGRDINDMITNNIDSIPTRGEPKKSNNLTIDDVRELFNEMFNERSNSNINIQNTTKPTEEHTASKSESVPNVTETTSIRQNENVEQVSTLSNTENKKEHISPLVAKSVLRNYSKVLEKSAKQTSDIESVNLCRDLIWRWFDSRILHKKGTFRYSVINFNKYIYAIVTCFGYHLEHNSLTKFIDKFDEWIDSISIEGNFADKYALPYEVNTIYCKKESLSEEKKKEREKYANNTAAVLWDVLWNESYSELKNMEVLPKARLRSGGVWDLINKLNIDALDKYLNYKAHPEVLQLLYI